mgnify:CR=1 FL=1
MPTVKLTIGLLFYLTSCVGLLLAAAAMVLESYSPDLNLYVAFSLSLTVIVGFFLMPKLANRI